MVRDVDRSQVDDLLRTVTPSLVAETLGMAVVKRGARLRCMCPFHDDHDPSLNLYDTWGNRPPHYHCFACGADGDIFDLVRHVRQSTFPEALDWLCASFGVQRRSSRPRSRPETAVGPSWIGTTASALENAARIFKQQSISEKLDDWLEARRLPRDLAKTAELSFSNGRTLIRYLQEGFASRSAGEGRVQLAMLEDIGLVKRTSHGNSSTELFESLEDRFRDFFFDNRVIFPIRTLTGDVAGFAARQAGPSSKSSAKYLYSPGLPRATLLYRGPNALAALKNRASKNLPKELFVCEGLVDALRLETTGTPAVSILGAQASIEQLGELRKIADAVAPEGDLKIYMFLDRDKAGLQGSAKLAMALAEGGFDASFVWPTEQQLDVHGVPAEDRKDPDGLVAALGQYWDSAFVSKIEHPTALAVISAKLGRQSTPDDLVGDEQWSLLSLGQRFRAAKALGREAQTAAFLLNTAQLLTQPYAARWIEEVARLRSTPEAENAILSEATVLEFIKDVAPRLNVARALAKSGADRGEVPTDEAAWRRLDLGATAFNLGLRERLAERSFEPMEPFDAVHVARDFSKAEPRLKTMPCPEDLVLQQYMLSESLTERFDSADGGESFSRCIPAVRFYRSEKKSVTTAEDRTFEPRTETLSFAYQIDMDVLEGRSKASNQGMFRPYIECWREYISALKRKSAGFEEVFALRLDLKRYYDRLHRSTVRDAIKTPFEAAFERLEEVGRVAEFAPPFLSRHSLSESLADWFCDQSFDYEYYHPDTGEVRSSSPGVGIPQGPILSAWLATVALFPLDSALRKVLRDINGTKGATHAAYARYVDDIFLVADSQALLERLRAEVEDACLRLRLEAIPKGDIAQRMSPSEFRELLTEGKTLFGSGPTQEVALLELGDGEAGYETWHEAIERSSSLGLLSDRRLYESDTETIKAQVFTALNAHDLRPADLPKAARWIWYVAARDDHESAEQIWGAYWSLWTQVTHRIRSRMNVAGRPWHDPSLYALDGLERLLNSSTTYDKQLPKSAEEERLRCLLRLSKLILQDGFFSQFAKPSLEVGAPAEAGTGLVLLRRMFLQRSVGVRWIARQYADQGAKGSIVGAMPEDLDTSSTDLRSSLVRAWLTDAEGASFALPGRAAAGRRGNSPSALRPLFLWLHKAIVLMGREPNLEEDQLAEIRTELEPPLALASEGSNSSFYRLLELLLPDFHRTDELAEGLALDALATLLAVCHAKGILSCLKNRQHLMGGIGRLLPSVPGISVNHLVAVTSSNDDEEELQVVKHIAPEHSEHEPTSYRDATAYKVSSISLRWEDESLEGVEEQREGLKRLRVRKAAWESLANHLRTVQPSPSTRLSHVELHWVADCFEALSRINYDLESATPKDSPSEVYEYVPAWPYVSSSRWAESDVIGAATFSLIGPLVRRTDLANQAFARDGSGRLRTHEVPLGDAALWRIGYAVTDLMGLSDELERFRALDENGIHAWDGTSRYVLTRLLSRLRGDGANGRSGHRHPDFPHLTGTAYRALELLRSYPKDGGEKRELWFLLCIESETAAMRLKSNGHEDNVHSGVVASLLCEMAQVVFARMSARQLHALPKMQPADGPYGTERRSVSAWRLVDRRLSALEDDIHPVPENMAASWSALRIGVRIAAVTCWIRSLVLEIQTSGMSTIPSNAPIPVEWEIEAPALSLDGSGIELAELFRDSLSPEGRLGLTAQVTPLGWLALLAAQLGIYDESGRKLVADADGGLAERLNVLARALAAACPEDALLQLEWPFDARHSFPELMDESMFDRACELLAQLQQRLNIEVQPAHGRAWGLQQQAKLFTDMRGNVWRLTRGLVDQVGRDRHVETLDGREESHRVWTETIWNKRLVGVSVLGSTFARTVGMNDLGMTFDQEEAEPAAQGQRKPPIESAELLEPPNSDRGLPRETEPEHEEVTQGKPGVSANDESKARKSRPVTAAYFEQWKRTQMREWAGKRRGKSMGHVRVALFQFRIDDSYYHPLLDAGFPAAIDKYFCTEHQRDAAVDGALSDLAAGVETGAPHALSTLAQRAKASLSKAGSEARWTESAIVPSWNEHRRRRLILEAIDACEAFNVELLVLPEYSVRPDTVEWLRAIMDRKGVKTAVVAGTYRLHGEKDELHFSQRFGEIFGSGDAMRVFGAAGPTFEKSAFVTLLQPMEVGNERYVGVFSRRKKYHSMAMNEFINPSTEPWEPLLNGEKLVGSINSMLATRSRPPLDAGIAFNLARNLKPAERVAELICSELFAATHPVNELNIQAEYEKLLQRFGRTRLMPNSVKDDTDRFSTALLHMGQVDRRTIVVVPACTTRSADYWIFGQSGLLAAGLTTVFCAAVLSDGSGLEGGGSCVIGKSSWAAAKDVPGKLTMSTPYSGWSRGIYYNKQSDALGPKEQALVIADIDPVYMNEGKPRPQALAHPIQLVAHMPVLEMVDPEKLRECYVPANGGLGTASPQKTKPPLGMQDLSKVQLAFQDLGTFIDSFAAHRPLNAGTKLPDGTRVDDAAEALSDFFADPSGWRARLECWRRNWRDLPFYGPPPTLVDWLPVDLSPEGELASVLIPPWGGDEPLHAALKRE